MTPAAASTNSLTSRINEMTAHTTHIIIAAQQDDEVKKANDTERGRGTGGEQKKKSTRRVVINGSERLISSRKTYSLVPGNMLLLKSKSP